MHPDTFYRVALSRVRNIGPITSRALIKHFGSAEAVFQARAKELKVVTGVAEKTIGELQIPTAQHEAEQIMRFTERFGVQIHHFTDSDFPWRFARHGNAPALFYSKGHLDLNTSRSIAVIGTRKPSSRGIQQTELLLSGLKEYQPLIISGLAYGVDINAHRKSLQVGLSTVGVLGSGLNKIYPDAHRSTAKKMFATGGLLSVYPHWVGPEKDHFPARNRIVAMLADMVIVVESDRQGGSMITANMANEMKTPVGAFPGRHEDKKSAGCNELIKKNRAHLIESAEDVAQVLNWLKSELHNQQGKLFQDLTEEEQAIVKQLTEYPDASVDDLRKSLAWPAAKLAGKILDMELKGMLRVLPGPRYRLAY